jgi:hypothetical protein
MPHASHTFARSFSTASIPVILLQAVRVIRAAAYSMQGDYQVTSTASDVPLIPRADLFGNPERTDVEISPDGRFLSWLAPVNGVLNVWVAPLDDLSLARAVTNDTNRGLRFHLWTYDGPCSCSRSGCWHLPQPDAFRKRYGIDREGEPNHPRSHPCGYEPP